MNICFCPELLDRNAREIVIRAISTALIQYALQFAGPKVLHQMVVFGGRDSYNKLTRHIYSMNIVKIPLNFMEYLVNIF